MNILSLPETLLMDIFEWLPYDEVAKKREVCTRFNYIGKQVLNTGFNKIILRHGKNFKRIKSMLPRRESERRNHVLARHSDILTSIETRISMLTMTYSKFIDLNICCFIPGRVLDEIASILRLLSSTTKPLRPHEVLQELRDISSMAIEHFDEKIAVNFKMEHRKQLAESTAAAAAASGTRLVVCGTLGDISFSGKRSAIGHGICQQAIVQLNPLSSSVSNCSNQQSHQQPSSSFTSRNQSSGQRERFPRDYQKQLLIHKTLLHKVNSLEVGRKLQDRRLQEALGSITELTTQVSELKRQLEDVKATVTGGGKKPLKRRSNSGGGGGCGQDATTTISHKKPKVG
ncbi:F-box only protein 28 [Drosophila tropicalis]|uniref:F-box only protein 28 n=1 Tax=Drosophila tropicalis TaxID=46794 RepID=UPI0035ABBDE9